MKTSYRRTGLPQKVKAGAPAQSQIRFGPTTLFGKMKRFIAIIIIGFNAYATEPVPESEINAQPFEPPADALFRRDDKFAQPKQVVAYQMLWPIEMNRARSVEVGDVVVLVQITADGHPKRLSVLSSTDHLFARSALQALRKTRWESVGKDVWFYFKAHFDLAEIWNEPKK